MPKRGIRAEIKRDKQVNVLTAATFHSSHMTGGTASGRQTGGICLPVVEITISFLPHQKY